MEQLADKVFSVQQDDIKGGLNNKQTHNKLCIFTAGHCLSESEAVKLHVVIKQRIIISKKKVSKIDTGLGHFVGGTRLIGGKIPHQEMSR